MHESFEILDIKAYMDKKEAEAHIEDIKKLKQIIESKLESNKNFDKFDLSDVSAGGIQVRMFHKNIKNYSYGQQFTINHEWNNIEEVANKAVENFMQLDTEEQVNKYNTFLKAGEKYGWD